MNSLNIREVLVDVDKNKSFFLREQQKICSMPREYLQRSNRALSDENVDETLYIDEDNDFSKKNVESAIDDIFNSISI